MSQHVVSSFKYNKLRVKDAKTEDMIMLHDVVFRPTKVEVGSHHRIYLVDYAIVQGVTYLRSLQQYKNHEFSYDLFGFRECKDFFVGKVVIVHPDSTLRM